MLETILELLREAETDGWEVTDTKTEGWEFYFIRHQLDQNRVRDVEHINVRVYKRFDEYLGSAACEIPVSAGREEAKAQISQLIDEAKLVRNPVFTLNMPSSQEVKQAPLPKIEDIARDFIEAMNEIPETETEDINSYEIFVSLVTTHFLNSNGIDVISSYPSSMIEVVVNARRQAHEIELYRMYKSGTCDRQGLKDSLVETMRTGKDKLIADKTPNLGTFDVVFSGEDALEIYQYMLDKMNAAIKYRGMSDWETGQPVAQNITGDKVTIKAVTELKNSSSNAAYDAQGALRRDMTIIEDGVAKHYWGDRQFSQYLGLEDSFIVGNFVAEGGTSDETVIRSGDYLEAVEFSDFQVDTLSGSIAGEIRLAYLHHNGEVKIVSGGSVSGSMRDLIRTMKMSGQLRQYNNARIPALTRLCGATVTGAQ